MVIDNIYILLLVLRLCPVATQESCISGHPLHVHVCQHQCLCTQQRP